MLQNLKTVLNRFRKYGLKLKPSKCKLFRREVHFLGRIADRHGVRMTKEHIQDVLNWPVPANRKELQRFLGFINYHRNYLQALAGKTAILFAWENSYSFRASGCTQEMGLDRWTHAGLLCFASSHDGGSSAGISQCHRLVHPWKECLGFCYQRRTQSATRWKGMHHIVCQQVSMFQTTRILYHKEGTLGCGSIREALSTLPAGEEVCGQDGPCQPRVADVL